MLQNSSQFARFVWSLVLADRGGRETYSEEEIAQMLIKALGLDSVVAHLKQFGCSLSEILGNSSYFKKDAHGWRRMLFTDEDGRSLEDDFPANINQAFSQLVIGDDDIRPNQFGLSTENHGEKNVYSDIQHNHHQQHQISLPHIATTNSDRIGMMLSGRYNNGLNQIETDMLGLTHSRILAQQDHHEEGYVHPNVHYNHLYQKKVSPPDVSTNSENMMLTCRFRNGEHQESIACSFVQPIDGGNTSKENHQDPYQNYLLAQHQLGAELYSNNQHNQHQVRSPNAHSDRGRLVEGSSNDTGKNQKFKPWPSGQPLNGDHIRNQTQQNMFQNHDLDHLRERYCHSNFHSNHSNQQRASPMSSALAQTTIGDNTRGYSQHILNVREADRQESGIRSVFQPASVDNARNYCQQNLPSYNVTEGRQLVAEFYSNLDYNLHNQHQVSPPHMQLGRRDSTYNTGVSQEPTARPFVQPLNGDEIRNENQRNLYQDNEFFQQQGHQTHINPNIHLNQLVIPPNMSSPSSNGGGMVSSSNYKKMLNYLGADMYSNVHQNHLHQAQVIPPNMSLTSSNGGGINSSYTNGGQHDHQEFTSWPFGHPTNGDHIRNEYQQNRFQNNLLVHKQDYQSAVLSNFHQNLHNPLQVSPHNTRSENHQDAFHKHILAQQLDQKLVANLYFNNQHTQHQVSPPNVQSNRGVPLPGSIYNTKGGDNHQNVSTWPFVRPPNGDHIRNEYQENLLESNAAELHSNFNQNQHNYHQVSPSNMSTANSNGREMMMSSRYCNPLNREVTDHDPSTGPFSETKNGDDSGSYNQHILFSKPVMAQGNNQSHSDLYNNILRNFQQQGIDPVGGSFDIGQLLNRRFDCHLQGTNSSNCGDSDRLQPSSQQFPSQNNDSPVIPPQTEPEKRQELWDDQVTEPNNSNYSNQDDQNDDFFEKWEESSFNNDLAAFDYELEQQSSTISSISTVTDPSTSWQESEAHAAALPSSTSTLEELAVRFGAKVPEETPDVVEPGPVEVEENVKNFMAKFESMSINDQLHAHDEQQDPDPVVVQFGNVVDQTQVPKRRTRFIRRQALKSIHQLPVGQFSLPELISDISLKFDGNKKSVYAFVRFTLFERLKGQFSFVEGTDKEYVVKNYK